MSQTAISRSPQVGDPAPPFALMDQNGTMRRLADYRGKTLAVAFYPCDFTTFCTLEMMSLRDAVPALTADGISVVGISVQDVESKRAFAKKLHLEFPILADSSKSVARAYGVLNPEGMAQRVMFLIDSAGRISNIDYASRFTRTPTGIRSDYATAIGLAASTSWMASVGRPVPAFSHVCLDGSRINSIIPGEKATVLVFLTSGGPASQASIARIQNLHHIYFGSGFRFLGVFSNADETREKIETFGKENGVTFPLILDRYGKLAYTYGVTTTPEVWMIDEHGIAVYHGAVDGEPTDGPRSRTYLMDAMDSEIIDSDVTIRETHPTGDMLQRAGDIRP